MESVIVLLVGVAGLMKINKQRENNRDKESFSTLENINDVDTNNKSNLEVSSQGNNFINKNITSQTDLFGNDFTEKNPKPFTHNNMVPFFGGRMTARDIENDQNNALFDSYTGSGSEHISKGAVGPLFGPEVGVSYTHGAPHNTDFMQSRIQPSNNRHDVRSIEPQLVGPMNGNKSLGLDGFNSGMQDVRPKTVDELRVETNPKQSYTLYDHEGPAMSYVTKPGLHGKLEKNLPEKTHPIQPDMYSQDVHKKPSLQRNPTHIQKDVNDINVAYSGIQTGETGPRRRDAHVQIKKQHVYGETHGNNGSTEKRDNNFREQSISNRYNNRSDIEQTHRFGIIRGALETVLAPVINSMKPTRKQETVENLFQKGHISKIGAGGSYVAKDETIKNTLRSVTMNTPFEMNISGINSQGGYGNPGEMLFQSQRATTTTSNYGNPGTSYGARNDTAERTQRNNFKKKQISWTPNGSSKLFNNDINMTTLNNRDNDLNTNYLGNINNTSKLPNRESIGQNTNPCDVQDVHYQGQQINSELINQFKSNPYTQDVSSYFK
jgi:hypothetical protein